MDEIIDLIELKFGEITEVFEDGRAKVRDLDTTEITPKLIPIFPLAGDALGMYSAPVVGQPVAYIRFGEITGVILGAYRKDGQALPVADANEITIKIDSNTYCTINKSTKTIDIFGAGTVTVNAPSIKIGSSATEPAIKGTTHNTDWTAVLNALLTHTHTGVTTGGGVSGAPDPSFLAAINGKISSAPNQLASKAKVE